MDLNKKIKKLRLDREWTQAELAEKVGVQQKQISAYEKGISKPSTDALIRIAEVFEVSLDSLVSGLEIQALAKGKIKDKELLEYFQSADNFREEDKEVIKKVISAFATKNKIQELAAK